MTTPNNKTDQAANLRQLVTEQERRPAQREAWMPAPQYAPLQNTPPQAQPAYTPQQPYGTPPYPPQQPPQQPQYPPQGYPRQPMQGYPPQQGYPQQPQQPQQPYPPQGYPQQQAPQQRRTMQQPQPQQPQQPPMQQPVQPYPRQPYAGQLPPQGLPPLNAAQGEDATPILPMPIQPKEGVQIITVVSGKGGTGKTFFSVNYALHLSQIGKKVLVIDADFGLSNVDVMLGTKPKKSLGDVLRGTAELRDVICEGTFGVKYISGGMGDEALLGLKKGRLSILSAQMLESSIIRELDYLIFDCGAGVNDTVLQLLSGSDMGILVMTTEPTSLMDAFVIVKSLAQFKRKPPVYYVMNRAEGQREATVVARSFRNIVMKYVPYDLRYAGYISMDRHVAQSIKTQNPLMVSYPDCQAAMDLKAIVARQAAEAELFARVSRENVSSSGSARPGSEGGGAIRRFFERLINHE